MDEEDDSDSRSSSTQCEPDVEPGADEPTNEDVEADETQQPSELRGSCLAPSSGVSFFIHANFCRSCRDRWPEAYERALVAYVQDHMKVKAEEVRRRRGQDCLLQPCDGADFLVHVHACAGCRQQWPDQKIREVALQKRSNLKLVTEYLKRVFPSDS